MNHSIASEVLTAVRHTVRPHMTVISRLQLEREVLQHPYRYPTLSSHSQKIRRTFISKIMLRSFPGWGAGEYTAKSTIAWKVTPESLEQELEELHESY